jgi:hypothetical protein
MNKSLLEKEVKEYNEIIEQIQKLQTELNNLEQKRLIKFGRIQLIEENLSENKDKKFQDEVIKEIKIDEVIKDSKKSKVLKEKT